MPSPSTSQATLRPDLRSSFEEFDLLMNRQGFISQQVLPVIEVDKPVGKFGKIPLEQLLQSPDTIRAPGSGYNRGNFTFTSVSFTCEENGWEEPVDDRESAMYNQFFDAEVVSTNRAIQFVAGGMEKRVSDLIFNATTWTGAALNTTVVNEWDDFANALPIDDVEKAVQKVYDGTGLWPNALIINRKVFRNLRQVNQIIDRVKYQGFMDARAGNITQAALEQVFDLMLIVGGSTQNTANEAATASLSPYWSGEYAMIARVAMTDDPREPCVGRIFHWGEDGSQIGGMVESYRDEPKRSDIVRVRNDVDEFVLYKEAAHLLDNITT